MPDARAPTASGVAPDASATVAVPPLRVILVNPEIPPNTGNIARLCAATRTRLHLVHPLGFSIDDRHLKRAGLDYWPHVQVTEHESLEAALAASGQGPVCYFSARTGHPYDQAPYAPGTRLVFGPETRGLPPELLAAHPDACYRIPIWGRVRSINLSTAVGIVVYEGYRQMGAWSPEPGAPCRGGTCRVRGFGCRDAAGAVLTKL